MHTTKRNLLVFGYGLALILTFIAVKLWRAHGIGWIHVLLGAGIGLLVLITLFRQDLLERFYVRWMKVAFVLGTVMTGVILSVLFYVIFAPIGILLRFLKKDFLDRHIDRNAPSYWSKLEKVNFDKSRYTQQF